MKNKKKTVSKLYAYNKNRNSYSIDVSLDDYDDVYGTWDDSSFRKRVVENEFEFFVLQSTQDIPLKYGIQLNLHLPLQKEDKEKEYNLKKVYKSYYSYAILREKNKKKLSFRKIVNNFILGSIFLVAAVLSVNKGVIISLIDEGLFVLAWVVLWEAAEEFLFVINAKEKEIKNLKRLREAKISFIYRKDYE